MLDVHPPHEAAHSWKDFFIHIATIVIGLLIAVGLEQTVQYIHHWREVAETRERIRAELTEAREIIRDNMAFFTHDQQQWQTDNEILQQSTSSSESLANLKYASRIYFISTSAWQTAGKTGTLSLLAPEEASQHSYLYALLDQNNDSGPAYIQKVDTAKTIAARLHRRGSVSPADQQRLLTITDELGGSATEQLELYTYVDARLKDWLANH